ncbi:MAG: hypothetical protein M0R03_10940 [Novosphingobium sp.]|nr:hypothetical protein [Novosphingobium sp.]
MWFENLVFAPKIPAYRFSQVSEAIAYAEEVTVTPIPTTLGDLIVNTDATIGDNKQKITRYGFEKLCVLLGIPKPFAQKIPNDLLFENIRRLKADNPGQEIVVLERNNGEIASIVKAPYTEPSYGEMLSVFQERPDLKYIDVEEKLLTICVAFDDVCAVGESDADTLFVSSFMYGSITKETKMKLFSGLYRTQCSNSFICPFLGSSFANYQHKDKALMLSRFAETVRCYNQEIANRILNRFSSLLNRNMFKHEVARMWAGLSMIVGKSEADVIIGFGGDEERKVLLKEVETWKATNRRNRIEGKTISEPTLSPFKTYKVLNDITAYSKDHLHGVEKKNTETLAGNWIHDIILN